MIRGLISLFLAGIITINLCKSQNKISCLRIHYDSIRIVLEKVYDRDQDIRRILSDSLKPSSPDFNIYISKMFDIDAENLSIVIPLLEKYGFMPKSKIGEKAHDGIFYVIQHSNLDLMEKYFPQYDSLAKIGEANRRQAAMMEDRLLMNKGLKQKYGSQAISNEKTGNKMKIWPIEHPEQVDSLRKAVGYKNTVKEQAKEMGAIYDPDAKISDFE